MVGVGAVLDATQAGINITSQGNDANPTARFEAVHIHDAVVEGYGSAVNVSYNGRFMYGVWIGASGCQGFSNVTLQRITATNNWNTGITSFGAFTGEIMMWDAILTIAADCYSHANVTVDNCTAYNNTGNAAVTDAWSGSGLITMSQSLQSMMQSLRSMMQSWLLTSHTVAGIVLSGVDGAVITHSTAHHNGAHNGHLGGGPCWNNSHPSPAHF